MKVTVAAMILAGLVAFWCLNASADEEGWFRPKDLEMANQVGEWRYVRSREHQKKLGLRPLGQTDHWPRMRLWGTDGPQFDARCDYRKPERHWDYEATKKKFDRKGGARRTIFKEHERIYYQSDDKVEFDCGYEAKRMAKYQMRGRPLCRIVGRADDGVDLVRCRVEKWNNGREWIRTEDGKDLGYVLALSGAVRVSDEAIGEYGVAQAWAQENAVGYWQ